MKSKITAMDILEKAAELKRSKSEDYQGSMWSEEDYFPFGDESYIHMLWTKMLRLRSVIEQENSNHESAYDTLLDMINYCAMYGAYLKNQENSDE